jgi:hypothetical protein
MANRIIPMILIVEVFTHKCFDDNYHKIAYTSKHINIVEITFYNTLPPLTGVLAAPTRLWTHFQGIQHAVR